MPFWFLEKHSAHHGLAFEVTEVHFSGRSPFQKIDLFETPAYGRMLVLDDYVMTTERDEHFYHEALVHPGLAALEAPRRVLIVGGGDGGTAREVLRHPMVERVDMVEIDAMVVEVARRFLPSLSGSLSDKRLHLTIGDGAGFVREARGPYDAILVDGTDPVGPGIVLFNEEFYTHCRRLIGESGLLVTQSESPVFQVPNMRVIYANLRKVFPRVHPYFAPVPTYGGYWSFAAASVGVDPTVPRREPLPFPTRVYNGALHRAAFAVPEFLREVVGA